MGIRRDRNGFLCLLVFLSFFLSSCQGFDEQLLYNKASRLHNEGKFEEAIAIYEKLLRDDPADKINPDNGIIAYDLGVAYIDSGNTPGAFRQYSYLKKLKRPDLASALDRLIKRAQL
jgi:tetratricopeptide (TPR) repeat protein